MCGQPVPEASRPQAGAIAVRERDGRIEVLLVTPLCDPCTWIFPKGKLEPGESAEDAALRELEEEGGVRGETIGPAGALQFLVSGESIHVDYFVVRCVARVRPLDRRRRHWYSYPDALNALSHADARRLLQRALPLIESGI